MNFCLWCFEEMITHIQWGNVFKVTKPKILCSICDEKLERLKGNRCIKCSRPQAENNQCFDCERWNDDALTANYSLYTYNEFMKEVVAKWKYRGDYCLRDIFRDDFNQAIQKFMKSMKIKPTIVPIPLSDERTLERGFNQAKVLAELVGQPVLDVMERVHSEKQSKMGRYERMHTTNPFKVTTSMQGTVIIIDDIYTTGRTLRHAANLLKDAGATEVYAFTLIRG